MKRILLYGATGRTGRQVLNIALEMGYEVNALVRDPAKLDVKSDRLQIFMGTPTNIYDVRKAIKGCDIVISTLGALTQSQLLWPGKIDPPHTLEQAMRNTIQCMEEAGIKRIIVQTALGAGQSITYAPWIMKMLIRYTHFKIVYNDHNIQEQLLIESNLDWIIARPVGLNNNDAIKKLAVTYDTPPPAFQISRRHVAQFMMGCVEGRAYVHKAPVISETD